MKIAVIGSGISGLSSAYYLSKKHKVDLFEKEDHFGGHAHTIDIDCFAKAKLNNEVIKMAKKICQLILDLLFLIIKRTQIS